jgi:hypothetical protein
VVNGINPASKTKAAAKAAPVSKRVASKRAPGNPAAARAMTTI